MLRGCPSMLHQKLGEVKPTSLGLSHSVTKPVSDGLNILLASCYSLYHQVKKHQWVVEGPNSHDLKRFLAEKSSHLRQTADLLAERITILGAYPISTPRKQQEMTFFPN